MAYGKKKVRGWKVIQGQEYCSREYSGKVSGCPGLCSFLFLKWSGIKDYVITKNVLSTY